MRRANTVLVMFFVAAAVVLVSSEAQARWGWYFDLYSGVETHTDIAETEVGNNRIISAPTEVSHLLEFDFGYSWENGWSFGAGIELENWVMPNLKLDLKYSFRENTRVQPYIFTCLHGALTDWVPLGMHIGAGVDYYVSPRFYLTADFRVGYELAAIDPQAEHHLEAGVSVGFGVGGSRQSGFTEDEEQ